MKQWYFELFFDSSEQAVCIDGICECIPEDNVKSKFKELDETSFKYKGSKPKVFPFNGTRINTSPKFTIVSDHKRADFILIDKNNYKYNACFKINDIHELLKLKLVENTCKTKLENADLDNDIFYTRAYLYGSLSKEIKDFEESLSNRFNIIKNINDDIFINDNIYTIDSFYELINKDGVIITDDMCKEIVAAIDKINYYKLSEMTYYFYMISDCNIKKSFNNLCIIMSKCYIKMCDTFKGTSMSSRMKELSIKLTDKESSWSNESFVKAMRDKWKIKMSDEELLTLLEEKIESSAYNIFRNLENVLDNENCKRAIQLFIQPNKSYRKFSEKYIKDNLNDN